MTVNDALASALEVANRPITGRTTKRFFAMLLLALFFMVLMGGLASGARAYSAVAAARSRTDAVHMRAGLLTNIVRMNDAAHAVRVDKGPEGPALVLEQVLESGTYETRVYAYRGTVMQEYAIAGREYNPQGAIALCPSTSFGVELQDGLVCITTDEGEFSVALRSEQGEASGV